MADASQRSFRGFENSRNLEVAHHEHVSFQPLTSFFPAAIMIHEPRALVYPRFALACQTPVASNDALPYRAGHENHQRLLWSVVRLTDERLAHIMEHAELAGMEDEIERLLQSPSEVRRSRSDDNVMLFYEFYTRTRVGEMAVWGGKVLAG